MCNVRARELLCHHLFPEQSIKQFKTLGEIFRWKVIQSDALRILAGKSEKFHFQKAMRYRNW